MPFSIPTLQKLQEILKNKDFSEKHALVQKMGFKKDSVEVALDLGEIGTQKLESQAEEYESACEPPALASLELASVSLRSTLEARLWKTQNQAYEALQMQASVDEDERKVEILSTLNHEAESSLSQTLHTKVQPNSIPMLFAVLSRKNDAYGLGSMGAS
ncbi:hypothetical protein AGMMS49949_08290 [Alphaproteobacteria bacterium]|nr:hypothetical protein AGMMS49949_08290 [Alphaproteobacteria bacterium]GHS99364.1 hypothetical protein AGMMS50296_7490 [Alphaproteobacteria bacterium]